MKAALKIIFVGSFLFSSAGITAQHISRLTFNKGWQFKLDSNNIYNSDNVGSKGWRTLDLPHDWSIEGAFRAEHHATAGGGALPGGIGWYRKTFTVPPADKNKSVYLQFDGIYRNSEVWINGHALGKRPNGYIGFQYELTSFILQAPQQNIIIVKVDNSKQPNSRWYSGSGIYRNVWLNTVEKNHIANWGTFISTTAVHKKAATINVETRLVCVTTNSKPVLLRTIVYDAKGKKVTEQSIVVNVKHTSPIQQTFKIVDPRLWSIDQPHQYKAVSQLLVNEKVSDTYETKFGIRYFHFDVNKGFFLNGEHVKILGVCNHHDLGALGTAINTRALQRQLEILKAMGCNGIRTSHNPPAPELLQLCDEMGFIVIDEAFDMWAKPKSKYDYHLDWEQWFKKDMEDQVIHDRNHPSVFMWSIGNEIIEQWGDAAKGDTAGRVIARELVKTVRSLDTTREIVTANNEVNTYNQILQSGVFDLVGYNYQHRSWEKFHERWPGRKLIVTESTSALQTRGHYELVPFDTLRRWPKQWDIPFTNPNGSFTVSAYDHVSAPWGSTHEESVKALLKNDFVSGMYIWTGFDYLGEPTPYSWPARSSYFGIIDLAGFPKDVYYMYQSVFTETPVLHLYPHWNWNKGDTVDVVCYYNQADEVELFSNGRSAGVKKKRKDNLHVKWRLAYEPGIIRVISRKNNKVVLEREVKTAGPAAKIILKTDRKRMKSDGKDLCFITAFVVDQNGVVVPRADNVIQFKVSGAGFIAGVDSGDPISHEPFKADKHSALNGRVLLIVQSNGKKGPVTISAESSELKSNVIGVIFN